MSQLEIPLIHYSDSQPGSRDLLSNTDESFWKKAQALPSPKTEL